MEMPVEQPALALHLRLTTQVYHRSLLVAEVEVARAEGEQTLLGQRTTAAQAELAEAVVVVAVATAVQL
jgi:hypothetical protein